LEVGQTYTVDVLSGEKVWPLVVKIEKRESVHVPAGRFDCFRVEPLLREPGIFVSKGKKLEVWLTADERHLPVRMRSEVLIGHVSAELMHDPAAPVPAAPLPSAIPLPSGE
jgi:anti-sigma-K factor RskA